MNNTATKTNSKFTIQQIAMIAVMTAVTCVLAPLSVPIGPVPISLTNLVIYFSLFILGTKKGTISYLIYLLIGLVGIPVFSGFTSGARKALWTNRWLSDRFYPSGTDRRLLYQPFSS